MTIYELLESKQKYRRPFSSGEEFLYFIERRHLLGKFKRFEHLYDSEENEFDIFRANILLQGLENKELIEKEILNLSSHGEIDPASFMITLKERIIDQPYYEVDDIKIYIPFFSRALNEIYINEPQKILSLPYSALVDTFENSCIDPFDVYGADLFNSFFTKLVKVSSSKHVSAFFHYDTNSLYFINDQGRLDAKIVLFDKYMKKPKFTHMLERLNPVIDAYYNNDRTGLINALKDNNLISSQMHKKLLEL